jgi:3-isopropylmalate/(R)-2-methylmalate dehydratase large subunit
MAQTLYDKILSTHTVKRIDDDTILLYADVHFMNEYTSPQAFSGLREKHREVIQPDAHLCVVDHIIPTADVKPRVIIDEASARQAQYLEENCDHFGIAAFYGANDPGQGIEHVVMVEQGLVRPGMVVICGDSHTTTHGALGTLGFGIGTSEIEHILATQTLVYRLAKTMRIHVTGTLPEAVTSKDLALAIIRKISARGARGHVVEYTGPVIEALSVEARMTLCNLTVEAGARGAMIAPDEKTIEYVLHRAHDLKGELKEQALAAWKELYSDEDAEFDRVVEFDATNLEPYVTWGTSPDQCMGISEVIPTVESIEDPIAKAAAARALGYMGLSEGQSMKDLPIDHVFVGSCTNSRMEDLRIIAEIVKGKKVAANVRAQIVPGSTTLRRQCEAEGLADIFKAAGFEWRNSGCSLCLAMNDDVLASGKRCVSTTNRNFEGRQGRGSRTHLVSPAMAAHAALAGRIVDIR